MSEITVELKNPFEYSYKGDMVEAQFIVMPEPGFKELDKIAPIKQAFVAAVNDLASEASEPSAEAPEGDTESITGPQIMALMYRSKGNMSQVFLYAQLTVPIMEKMSVSDFERLLGEYLANFIAPSLMDGL